MSADMGMVRSRAQTANAAPRWAFALGQCRRRRRKRHGRELHRQAGPGNGDFSALNLKRRMTPVGRECQFAVFERSH